MRSKLTVIAFMMGLLLGISQTSNCTVYSQTGVPEERIEKVVALLVQFTDQTATTSVGEIQTRLARLDAYWREVSYEMIRVSVVTYGWYNLSQPMSYYGQNPHGERRNQTRYFELIRESVSLAKQDVDFSAHSMLMIAHSGNGEELSQRNEDLWSWSFWEWTNITSVGKTLIRGAAIVPESQPEPYDPFGTYVHEFGHLVGSYYGDKMGLPDLYDYEGKETFVGEWSLMADGAQLGNGCWPAGLDAYCRIKLGFIQPVKISASPEYVTVSINAIELYRSALSLPINKTHYYLVEMRQKIGFDRFLPDEGVIVYLVDGTKSSGHGIVKVVLGGMKVEEVFEAPTKDLYFKIISKHEESVTLAVSSRMASVRVEHPFQWIMPVIEIEVTDQNNEPIPGINTRVSVGNRQYSGMTDENGIVQLELDIFLVGKCEVTIICTNAVAKTGRFEIILWGPTILYLLVLLVLFVLFLLSRRHRSTERSYTQLCDQFAPCIGLIFVPYDLGKLTPYYSPYRYAQQNPQSRPDRRRNRGIGLHMLN